MSLNPLGTSTGMDINSMVSKIVEAERAPKQQRIDNAQVKIDTSISAYGRLRESLDTMKNLMANFRREEAFAVRKVESTDEETVSATATTDAIAGRYAIDVLQLAQSQKIASEPLTEDTQFGPGKLQIKLGTRKFTVNVNDNSTLKDVVRGINDAGSNPGVRAAIVNDTEGQRLVIASDRTGAENQISIFADTAADNPLKKLEYMTLEERVKALEEARNAAAEAQAAPVPGQEVADSAKEAQGTDATSAEDSAEQASAEKTDAQSKSETAAQSGTSVLPEDNIPGWNETTSGTLLDSYRPPEPELDEIALDKMSDVPGWTNTASGTLTDSYETPKEAEAARQKALEERKQAIDEAVESGEITKEEGRQLEMEQMSPEERAREMKIDETQEQLKQAEESFYAYNGMTEVQAAQDSVVMLDGIAQLSSDNNVINDAIEGIDITVKGVTDPNKTQTEIDVEYDRQSVRSDIEQFVNSYNQFYQTSRELSAADPSTGMQGPLAGDSIVRSAESRLKTVFTSAIDGAPENLQTLTEFGITTTRQGTLEINYDMLDRQLEDNFTQLGDFFGGKNGFAKQVEDSIQTLTGPTGTIRTRENTLRDQTYRLQDDQIALNRRMENLEERTYNKFAAMQDVTAKMQSQFSGMMSAMG